MPCNSSLGSFRVLHNSRFGLFVTPCPRSDILQCTRTLFFDSFPALHKPNLVPPNAAYRVAHTPPLFLAVWADGNPFQLPIQFHASNSGFFVRDRGGELRDH